MVVVVLDRLLVEERLLVGVLHPARLGHDRQVAAQLAGDAGRTPGGPRRSTSPASGASTSALTTSPPRVAKSQSASACFVRRRPLAERRAPSRRRATRSCQVRRWPIRSRPDQPWAAATGRSSSSSVSWLERLVRPPGVALVLEERQGIGVHGAHRSGRTRTRAPRCRQVRAVDVAAMTGSIVDQPRHQPVRATRRAAQTRPPDAARPSSLDRRPGGPGLRTQRRTGVVWVHGIGTQQPGESLFDWTQPDPRRLRRVAPRSGDGRATTGNDRRSARTRSDCGQRQRSGRTAGSTSTSRPSDDQPASGAVALHRGVLGRRRPAAVVRRRAPLPPRPPADDRRGDRRGLRPARDRRERNGSTTYAGRQPDRSRGARAARVSIPRWQDHRLPRLRLVDSSDPVRCILMVVATGLAP